MSYPATHGVSFRRCNVTAYRAIHSFRGPNLSITHHSHALIDCCLFLLAWKLYESPIPLMEIYLRTVPSRKRGERLCEVTSARDPSSQIPRPWPFGCCLVTSSYKPAFEAHGAVFDSFSIQACEYWTFDICSPLTQWVLFCSTVSVKTTHRSTYLLNLSIYLSLILRLGSFLKLSTLHQVPRVFSPGRNFTHTWYTS